MVKASKALSRSPLLAALCGLLWLAACSSAPPFDAEAMVREWSAFMDRDYVLRPGDKILVDVYPSEDLQQEAIVSPQGTVNLRRIPDALRATGKSIGGFRREVQAAYGKVLQDAEVSVSLAEASANTLYVTGEVRRPGPMLYAPGMTLAQAIASAGGLDIRAKWKDVRVLRYYGNADQVRTHRVNMSGVLLNGTPDFMVLPGDVVYCQTSMIADVNDFITLYITRMLPIQISGAAIPTN
ncbi:MAG: SLBB domain-containing protein [Planctomycetes bacterium]|nr:SLBB domain-containing protein [Planctomycetota bacterium]